MPNRKVILFLALSVAFAASHYFAVLTSLYWYLWWFDNVMHFWGGILLVLGVYAICSFKSITLRPTLGLVLFTLVVATATWEIFEWVAGLYEPATYVFETTKDVVVGFSGGLLTYIILNERTK